MPRVCTLPLPPLVPPPPLRARSFSCDAGQKTIKLEAVVPLAQMLIPPARWALVGDFAAFLGAHKRPVSKDAWNQLPLLMDVLTDGSKIPAYETSDAWPALFDDFTDFLRKTGRAAASS